MSTGLNAQIGYAVEATPGTYETVTKFFEFVPPLGLRKITTHTKSRAIRANRILPHAIDLGTYTVEGPVTHELTAETTGILLKAMIEATPVTAGTNPYTHTYDFSTEVASISAQTGLPATAAVHPIGFVGLRCRQWTVTVRPGDTYATLTLDWIGKTVDTDGTPALASASYATFTRFLFTHATVTVAGSEVCVDNFTLTGTTGWGMEHKVCSTDAGAAALFRESKATVTGSFVTDLANLTQLGRLHAGTQAAVVIGFSAGASAALTFTMNAEFVGEMPIIEGEGKTKETVNFEAIHATADASACTAVLTNTDSTP